MFIHLPRRFSSYDELIWKLNLFKDLRYYEAVVQI